MSEPASSYFYADASVRLEGDSIAFTFLRSEGEDVAEIWIPARCALSAATALLEVYFGRMQAARVAGRLYIEWEREQAAREFGLSIGDPEEGGSEAAE